MTKDGNIKLITITLTDQCLMQETEAKLHHVQDSTWTSCNANKGSAKYNFKSKHVTTYLQPVETDLFEQTVSNSLVVVTVGEHHHSMIL